MRCDDEIYIYSNTTTMFASVSEILPAIVGVGSEVLGGDGEDIGKLIVKRQAH